MITVVILFMFFNVITPTKEVAVISNSSIEAPGSNDKILCRGCGIGLSSSQDIVSKPSQASQFSFHDTLFTKDDVLVQVLLSDLFFHFPVITTKHSTCVGIGEWEESESWFPDYYWKPCVCADCGAYVGWVFRPIEPDISDTDAFFGLILTNVISETFLDSTTIFPNI